MDFNSARFFFDDAGQAAFVDREQHDLFGLTRPGVCRYQGSIYFGMPGIDGVDVLAESIGEDTSLDRADSGTTPHVVGDGGDEEGFGGADGFKFSEYVGGVFLEDFEF